MITIQLPGLRNPTLIESIVWLEGDANYTKVHCRNGKFEMVTHPLIWFERQLNFLRIHRSAMVNPRYVATFRQKRSRAGWVQLTDGRILPVSRSRLDFIDTQLRLNGDICLRPESAQLSD